MTHRTTAAAIALTAAFSLACGGAAYDMSAGGGSLSGINGMYCDEEAVCYEFKGDRADEYIDGELYNPASWRQVDSLLIVTFDDGATWTSDVISYSPGTLVLFDMEESETVTLILK